MKQVIQDLNSGKTLVENVPSPYLLPKTILVDSKKSLISLELKKI